MDMPQEVNGSFDAELHERTKESILSLVRRPDMYNDVRRFQYKFNQLLSFTPVHLTQRKLLERIRFMQEELQEFMQASCISDTDEPWLVRQDLALQADALVDLVYVALGTAAMMGLPWDELWSDVHRANMAKVPGTTHRGNLVDVCKPEGWVGPKTLDILIGAGYNPEVDNVEEHYLDDSIHLKQANNL